MKKYNFFSLNKTMKKFSKTNIVNIANKGINNYTYIYLPVN